MDAQVVAHGRGMVGPLTQLPLIHRATLPHALQHESQDAMKDHCTGELNIWVLILAQK